MNIYVAATLFSILIILYGLISEVFTVLFRLIGLPEEKARFQVISLCYVFNLTIVSAFVNIFVAMKVSQLGGWIYSFLVPLGAAILIISLFRFPGLRSRVDRWIEGFAAKLTGDTGYNSILLIDQLGQSSIARVRLKTLPEALGGKTLAETGLKPDWNILVLTVERDGSPAEPPTAETVFSAGDRLTVFGDYRQICEAFGAREHFADEAL